MAKTTGMSMSVVAPARRGGAESSAGRVWGVVYCSMGHGLGDSERSRLVKNDAIVMNKVLSEVEAWSNLDCHSGTISTRWVAKASKLGSDNGHCRLMSLSVVASHCRGTESCWLGTEQNACELCNRTACEGC